MNVALRSALPVQIWHQDAKKISLVKRTVAKDCSDDEFNVFIAVARDLNLNPLRKQIYAFVFSKNDAEKRNMTLVVGIDGARAIAARTGNYRPDDQEPKWFFNPDLKDPLANPHGIEKCTLGGELRRREFGIFRVNYLGAVRFLLDHQARKILGPAFPECTHLGTLGNLVAAGLYPLLFARIKPREDLGAVHQFLAENLLSRLLVAFGIKLSCSDPFIFICVAARHQRCKFFPIDGVNNALERIGAGRTVIDADGDRHV
jgi:hypothetical protein